MEVQVEEVGPCRRTLTIKVPPERIKQQIGEAYKAAASQVNIKGFRPGKVPRHVLEKKFGSEILQRAKEEVLGRSFEDACRENQIVFIGQPEVEGVDDSPLSETDPLEYQVHVDIRPPIELGEVTGVEIEAQSTEVTDEDMAGALQQLADQKKTLSKVDEPAADGDFVKADVKYNNQAGEVVLEKAGLQLNTTIPIAGADRDAFATKLRGAEPGQDLELELTFPATFEVAEVQDQPGSVSMHVLEVLRIQAPPLDDELAKSFDFESIDKLREELNERIAAQKSENEEARQEMQLLDIIANDHPFPLPLGMVESQVKGNLERYEQRLKENQTAEDEIKESLERAEAEIRQESERQIRMFFLIDEIAKKHELAVGSADIELEMRRIAAAHHATYDEVLKHYRENDRIGELQVAILERKVREFLRENARITDTKG